MELIAANLCISRDMMFLQMKKSIIVFIPGVEVPSKTSLISVHISSLILLRIESEQPGCVVMTTIQDTVAKIREGMTELPCLTSAPAVQSTDVQCDASRLLHLVDSDSSDSECEETLRPEHQSAKHGERVDIVVTTETPPQAVPLYEACEYLQEVFESAPLAPQLAPSLSVPVPTLNESHLQDSGEHSPMTAHMMHTWPFVEAALDPGLLVPQTHFEHDLMH
eukprot:gene35654-43959_t